MKHFISLLLASVVATAVLSACQPRTGGTGATGASGIDGRDGLNGHDGTNGSSCSVAQTAYSSVIVCTDGSTATVYNGVDGSDGIDGANGLDATMTVIDPCGDSPAAFDEVLFRLSDGRIFAYFESGSNRFLSLLSPGNYRTTDGSNCYFTVTASGGVQ